MADELRRLITDAGKLGFEFRGKTPGNHLEFVHANGERFITGSTPSDFRSWQNARADMEKISGRKLPRQNAAKYRFRKSGHLNFHRSSTEVRSGEEVEQLLTRAKSIRQRFLELAATARPSDIGTARTLLTDYERLRQALADHHRIIDPIF